MVLYVVAILSCTSYPLAIKHLFQLDCSLCSFMRWDVFRAAPSAVPGFRVENDAVRIWDVAVMIVGNMRPCHLLAQEPRSPHALGSPQLTFSHGVPPLSHRASIRRMYFPLVGQLPNLPPISLGKTHLPLSHPDRRRLHHPHTPPLLRATPKSRLLFR